MFPRSLRILCVLTLLYTTQASHFRHLHRQDDGTTDPSASVDPNEGVSVDPSSDAGASTDNGGVSATPVQTDVSASAEASSSGGTGGLSSGTGVLAGAGSSGGAVPVACFSCETTYSLINTCSSEGSSESCSPICTSWSAAITCLNCLLQNGQANLAQSAVQQVVWNLESSCSDLGFSVSSATIGATATTTGPFTTPAGVTATATATSAAPKSSHSGVTVYNDTTRTPVTATVTQLGYATNAAERSRSKGGKGAMALGVGVVGALMMEL